MAGDWYWWLKVVLGYMGLKVSLIGDDFGFGGAWWVSPVILFV